MIGMEWWKILVRLMPHPCSLLSTIIVNFPHNVPSNYTSSRTSTQSFSVHWLMYRHSRSPDAYAYVPHARGNGDEHALQWPQ